MAALYAMQSSFRWILWSGASECRCSHRLPQDRGGAPKLGAMDVRESDGQGMIVLPGIVGTHRRA